MSGTFIYFPVYLFTRPPALTLCAKVKVIAEEIVM